MESPRIPDARFKETEIEVREASKAAYKGVQTSCPSILNKETPKASSSGKDRQICLIKIHQFCSLPTTFLSLSPPPPLSFTICTLEH